MRVSNDTSSNQVSSAQTPSTAAASKAKKTEKASSAAGAAAAAPAPSDESTATISTRARDMAKAKAIAADTPDVRDDKVAELRKRISEGKYNVSPHDVANRMVDDHLKSEIG